ncbi:hypothetical protein PYCC9005_002090 [Savitreella phatthalungensis]
MTSSSTQTEDAPVATIVIGMAGAGKTTFMQRLNSHLRRRARKPYILNLDPAVLETPYPCNVDIRDTVNYKEVMKQYNLGPNGGILTSLNLFTTKFDQVLGLVEQRLEKRRCSHVLLDTPGQIEIFTWSASGAIITDALASSVPTVLTYVIDAPRSKSCSTFISSMLYAVSILYKTRLPMIVVFNKIDALEEGIDEQIQWMRDFESFQLALRREEQSQPDDAAGSGYMHSLMNSMSLVLEEFYNHLDVVGVSALSGAGFDDYMKALDNKRQEFEEIYKPEMEALRAERDASQDLQKKEQLRKLMQDMSVSDRAQTVSDAEEEEAEAEHNGELVDPDSDEEVHESVERSDATVDDWIKAMHR